MLEQVKCEHCVEMLGDPQECPYNRLDDEMKVWLKVQGTTPAQFCFSIQISRETDADEEYEAAD